uniref:Uncharacterized protein n=2 Tax=Tanacetum cinerariifolium TaxID=118510 RepID=A0A699I5F6_TANCI|nr:hypothetical protein [Tanacetum cinerariifolium]
MSLSISLFKTIQGLYQLADCVRRKRLIVATRNLYVYFLIKISMQKCIVDIKLLYMPIVNGGDNFLGGGVGICGGGGGVGTSEGVGSVGLDVDELGVDGYVGLVEAFGVVSSVLVVEVLDVVSGVLVVEVLDVVSGVLVVEVLDVVSGVLVVEALDVVSGVLVVEAFDVGMVD